MARQARPDRARPAERRRRRGGLLLVAVAILVLGGATTWFLLDDASGPSGEENVAPVAAAPAVPRALTPAEIVDPDEARRLAELLERRGRFAAVRDSFQAIPRESPASRSRLEPALRALWPARPPPFGLSCREAICRVALPDPVEGARAALAGDPGVRALADGVLVDPDGVDPAGYVLLAPAGAAPGQDVLVAVEQEFVRSTDARECLSRAGALGSVEYELRLESSGFTYRTRSDLPREVQDCVEGVLNQIITSTEVPQQVRTASVTLALRR